MSCRWHNGNAKSLAEGRHIDEDAFFTRLVNVIQGDNQRSAKETQLKRQFQVGFKCCGINDLDQHVRCWKVAPLGKGRLLGSQRPAISPEQVHENDLIVFAQVVQCLDRR